MSQNIVVPNLILPGTFERSMLDTNTFLQSASQYFNDRWKLHEFDPSGIKLPPHQPGFGWGVLVPPARIKITAQRIFEKLGERFPIRKYTDQSLDDILDPAKETRQPGETGYIIWHRNTNEADECHKNKSANQIAEAGINTMGLAERLLSEDFLLDLGWIEHLDINSWTLCSGSRDRGGCVPGVGWGGGLLVGWYHPAGAGGSLRARQVISC